MRQEVAAARATGLVAWLLEQVAEDERAAVGLIEPATTELLISQRPIHHLIREDPDPTGAVRFRLAECRAKRRIIASAASFNANPDYSDDGECLAWLVLLTLTLPYADRPGYLEEWRPDQDTA